MEYVLARKNEEAGYIIAGEPYEHNGKLYAHCICKCYRCGGTGRIPCYTNIDNGICFACGGGKYFHKEFRIYTPDERQKLDDQTARRRQKAIEKRIADNTKKRKEWLEKYNITNGSIYVVAGCNTYEIKDELKEQGAKYYDGIGWFFGSENAPSEDNFVADGEFLFHINIEDILYWTEANEGPYYKEGSVEKLKKKKKKESVNRAKAVSKSQWIGEVGERLKKKDAIFVSGRYFENEWGGKYIYTFKIGDNVCTWFSQTIIDEDIEPGDKIVLSGTVKTHSEFNGVLQTVLNRCIIKKEVY